MASKTNESSCFYRFECFILCCIFHQWSFQRLASDGAEGDILAVISDFVIVETRRNIRELKPEKLARLDRPLVTVKFEIVRVNPEDVADAKQWIVLKDAPVLAAAKIASVDMLATLDKKHFLGRPELETYINAPILTPIETFQKIRST